MLAVVERIFSIPALSLNPSISLHQHLGYIVEDLTTYTVHDKTNIPLWKPVRVQFSSSKLIQNCSFCKKKQKLNLQCKSRSAHLSVMIDFIDQCGTDSLTLTWIIILKWVHCCSQATFFIKFVILSYYAFAQQCGRRHTARHLVSTFYLRCLRQVNEANGIDTVFVRCVSVCASVRSGPVSQTSLEWLKLWILNLTCMFPGTIRTWPLKNFSKGDVARVVTPKFLALNDNNSKTVEAMEYGLQIWLACPRDSTDMTA